MTFDELDALVARSAVVGGYDSQRMLSREDFDALVSAARGGAPVSRHMDVEAVRQRHLAPQRLKYQTMYEGHVLVDLAAALDEIDALRERLASVTLPE